MKKRLAILIITLIFVNLDCMAQKHNFNSNEPQTVIKEIKRDNGQLNNVIVTIPSDYNLEKEYKVLYYLDAWWLKELVDGCYRIKSLSNTSQSNNIYELILMSVSSVGYEKDWKKQRNMYFTPSKYNQNLTSSWGSEQLNDKTTVGAKDFLSFFENVIIKSVEDEYKINTASRGILGHSFGGLFGLYSYLNQNKLFS